jgi:hypothetical protein
MTDEELNQYVEGQVLTPGFPQCHYYSCWKVGYTDLHMKLAMEVRDKIAGNMHTNTIQDELCRQY